MTRAGERPHVKVQKIAYLGIKGLPSKGGAERVVEPIVQQLAEQRPPGRQWELTVYCDSRYTPRSTSIAGVNLVRIPTLPGKYLQPVSLFILSTLHALFKGNYDLIHLHNIEACFALPLLRLRYRVIATAHGSPIRTARSKWGAFARTLMGSTEYPYLLLSNCATSVSRGDADYFEQRCGRVGHWCGKKVFYIPNGVKEQPIDQETAISTLHEIGIRQGEYILFAAGRIDPTKGCHLVLEAFYRLISSGWMYPTNGKPRPSYPDMKLVIVGDLSQVPDYSRDLRRMADERTLFIPHIAQKEKLFSIVQHCRLFIFPSLLEAMSMMLLEVAALGVPLICSDIPENKDVLDKYAVYFRSGDAKDLSRKMQWALENPSVLHRYADKAQDWVRSRHSWEKIVREYESLYEKYTNLPQGALRGDDKTDEKNGPIS